MGKGKIKAFKLKEYKVPPEKYVVVVNPWGMPDKIDMNTKLNEIAAWFELLLKKDYPNARVREIFYQKTHRNIIVELPREIDIEKYLGAYHYSQFHNGISPDDTRTAYIYEYRYANFGNPGNKNWSGIVPTNHTIPTGLLQVLKDPFPPPSPAPPPPSDTPYARPVPANIQRQLTIIRDATLITSASEDKGKGKSIENSPPVPPPPPAQTPNVDSSCAFDLTSTESLFTPYEPPSHYVAHVEASKSRIDQPKPVTHEIPKVKKMDPYEEDEVAMALLRSLSPSGDHKDVIVKSEAVKAELPHDEEYRPSGELLAAFANLADNFGYDDDDQSIKREPEDAPSGPSKMFSSSSSSNHHYPVPRDPRRSLLRPEDGKSDSQSSRDPRKRSSDILPIKHEEGHHTEDDGFMVFRKRLKMEH